LVTIMISSRLRSVMIGAATGGRSSAGFAAMANASPPPPAAGSPAAITTANPIRTRLP
jgi:hypothetical protein